MGYEAFYQNSLMLPSKYNDDIGDWPDVDMVTELQQAQKLLAAAKERERVLREAAQRLVDNAKNSKQELWASLPDVIALREALEVK